eukprot:TRINITY_DN59136_c0_g1_i1.p1 TRINITY_DN59136_c0_g1~~TRINITY_DN59136_c0_g1_i1.p1  ORF type:complete len:762 (+),score=79.52 TRINITY_DN59136_c0_g1_i1:76-2361(+)
MEYEAQRSPGGFQRQLDRLSGLLALFAAGLDEVKKAHDEELCACNSQAAGLQAARPAASQLLPALRGTRRRHSVGCCPLETTADSESSANLAKDRKATLSSIVDVQFISERNCPRLRNEDLRLDSRNCGKPVVIGSYSDIDTVDLNSEASIESLSEWRRQTTVSIPGAMQHRELDEAAEVEGFNRQCSPFSICSLVEAFQLRDAWVLSEKQMSKVSRRRRRSSTAYSGEFGMGLNAASDRQRSFDEGGKFSLPLHPLSLPRAIWNLAAVILVAYDFIVLPLVTFDLPDDLFHETMTGIILAYWTLDIGLSFATGCYVNGKLIMEWREICKQYLKTWLFFDLVILLPGLVLSVANMAARDSVGLLRALRSARTMRLLRFLGILRIFKGNRLLYTLKSGVNSTSLLLCLTVARVILGVILLCHLLASSWYFVGKQSPNGWIYIEGIQDRALGDKYLSSLQWGLARIHPSTFGKNDSLQSVPERIFAIVMSLFAFCGGGYFVSSITTTMSELQRLREGQTRKMHILREYIRDNNISSSLSMRVKNYVETNTSRAREVNTKQIAEFLPAPLVADLRLEAWSPIVAAHPKLITLMTWTPRFLWSLCKTALMETVVFPGDTVFATGDSAEKMFFVIMGAMTYTVGRSITSNSSADSEDIRSGQWLSEAALWTQWRHKGELCGEADSTLLTLDAEQLILLARGHRSSAVEMAYYAHLFVKALNEIGDGVTDLLPVDFPDDDDGTPHYSERSVYTPDSTSEMLVSIAPR